MSRWYIRLLRTTHIQFYSQLKMREIKILGARSFPLTITANGNVNTDTSLETRERSKSEILAPRTPSQELRQDNLDRDKSSSAYDAVGRVLVKEGLDDDDTMVRVVEQEIAEVLDVSTERLNEAAERLLNELETTLSSEEEGAKVNSDTSVLKSDDDSDSDQPSHFWREGLKGIPDNCIVITDL